MENRTAQTIAHQPDFNPYTNFDGGNDELTRRRLNTLLALNADTERKNNRKVTEKDRLDALAMKHPLTAQQAFAYYGILLGIFPPAAVFAKFFINNGNMRIEDLWILGLVVIINLIASITAFFSGKVIGKIIGDLENLSWTKMLIILPFIGMLWGGISGAAGGIIIFVFGAIFGAMIGGAVGTFALPIFTILHRFLKRDDKIDRRHFLPIAFGSTFIISAFILGL